MKSRDSGYSICIKFKNYQFLTTTTRRTVEATENNHPNYPSAVKYKQNYS